jgi:hypothetical protein
MGATILGIKMLFGCKPSNGAGVASQPAVINSIDSPEMPSCSMMRVLACQLTYYGTWFCQNVLLVPLLQVQVQNHRSVSTNNVYM